MPILDPTIFRAYDIRGKAHTQLSAEGCFLIGQTYGTILRNLYDIDHPRVAVGRDARTHSEEFEKAVTEGLVSSGCHVLRIGQTPSPVNYFTICTNNLDGGVQVTASHNPPEDNGLKLQMREAEAFCGENLQLLNKKIIHGESILGEGKSETFDAVTPYKKHLQELFGEAGKDMSIVIDTGNGVAGPLYSEILEAAGCEVEGLYLEPDGTFPNHPADPSKAETLRDLKDAVEEKKAALGFGFDGDGDRIGLIDELGITRNADELLLLLAEDHLKRHKDAPVIFTVSNSSILQTEITKWGGKPVMCKVGHSFVEHAMRQVESQLGGEQSGHFFCGEDYFNFDDAIVTALRVLTILSQEDKPISHYFETYPTVHQAPEQRPFCDDEDKTEVIEQITEHFEEKYPVTTLDGVRIDFGDGAWAGIRQSNTSPCISICIEARTPEKLEEIQETVLTHVKSYSEVDFAEEK